MKDQGCERSRIKCSTMAVRILEIKNNVVVVALIVLIFSNYFYIEESTTCINFRVYLTLHACTLHKFAKVQGFFETLL